MPGFFPTGSRPALVVAVVVTAAFTSLFSVAPTPVAAAVESRIARRCEGSSDPTLFSNNRRLVITARGRLLALYDPHGAGQQLVWRDPRGRWHRRTRGSVSDGFLHGSGRRDSADRPASIAVARDGRGRQSAWIVTSGASFGDKNGAGVLLRRLTGLNDPDGPRVGPAIRVQRGQGARADLAFERGPQGRMRGVITWLRRTDKGTFRFRTAWFTHLASNRPRIKARRTLFRSTAGTSTGALVPTARGMRFVATTGSSRLRLFKHRAGSSLRRWVKGKATSAVRARSKPSAVALPSGRVLAAADARVRGRRGVKVVRFSRSGDRIKRLTRRRGLFRPVLTSRRGGGARLVALRKKGRVIASRAFRPGSGWGRLRGETRVRGSLAPVAPNVPRYSTRRLRVLVSSAACPGPLNANGVVLYERRL